VRLPAQAAGGPAARAGDGLGQAGLAGRRRGQFRNTKAVTTVAEDAMAGTGRDPASITRQLDLRANAAGRRSARESPRFACILCYLALLCPQGCPQGPLG
jgi:hypothetical protein